MIKMTTYSFENFDYIDDDIILNKDVIFYRGIRENNPTVIRKDVPLYIGPKYIAEYYGNVYMVKTTKPIKLVDIRKMKNLLRLIIASRKSNENNNILNCIRYLTISFGLCSYEKQIYLLEDEADQVELQNVKTKIQNMKNLYGETTKILNPLNPEGVRVGETFIDSKSLLLLRELFKDVYDGFIAPQQYSPFHTNNYSHEEIVIFDPIKSGIERTIENPHQHIRILNNELNNKYNSYILKDNNFEFKIAYLEDKYKYYKNKKFMRDTKKEIKDFTNNIIFSKWSIEYHGS
jgi:hypothetical protein